MPDQDLITRIRERVRNLSLAKWANRQSRWKLLFLGVGTLGTLLIVVSLLLFVLVRSGFFYPIPTYADLANIHNNQASEIYSRNGKLLGKYYLENRVNADSSELPTHLIQALIATEDARFFDHGGVDLRSLGRVLIKSILLSNESAGGGSTISQQLAKNLYPRAGTGPMKIIIHKMREMLIARRLEKIYTKDQIVRLYMNTVPFGGNAFGIKVAAQRYFNKALESLTLDEGAVLVGMLKATSYYNPFRYPERATERRNVVLKQMHKSGYLTDAALDEYQKKALKVDFQHEDHNEGLATYFRAHLRLEAEQLLRGLTKPDGSLYNLYTDGLRLGTTLDHKMQWLAEESMKAHLSDLQSLFLKEWRGKEPWLDGGGQEKYIKRTARYRSMSAAGKTNQEINEAFSKKVSMTVFDWEQHGQREVEWTPLDSLRYYLTLLRSGMLAVDPNSGDVLAWVGGIDHRFIQYDHVKSSRQIGSLMKPIVYAAAIREGLSPCQYLENKLVQYADYEGWEPRNSDGNYGGFYSMEGALSHSINTVTVEVALQAGLSSIRKLAGSLGIENQIPAKPAIALGAVEASLWEVVQVFGTFANQGKRPKLALLNKIETMDGNVIWSREANEEPTAVISGEEAAVMNHMLQSVVDSGTARRLRYAYGIRGNIAGKTGTTQDQSDGWFVGYTPKLVAGVWVGAEVPNIHFKTINSGQGANSALPIWAKFMKGVQNDSQLRSYLSGSFVPPRDTAKYFLDCAPYLVELPILFDSTLDPQHLADFSRRVAGIDPEELGEIMERAPRRPSESLSEYSRRIRERNKRVLEKRERREKRKAFFDNLFGRKKK